MIGASLYITGCTARNRFRVRLRRLRQPRYLFGAIVGAAYFYFTLFARRRPARRRRGAPAQAAAMMSTMVAGAPPVVGTGLLLLAALTWLVPFNTGLVDFSDAEIDFLFTAPVRRRQLVLHRLIRSQIGFLFAAVVPAVLYPGLSPSARLRTSIAIWLSFIAIRVYATGVIQARRAFLVVRPAVRRLAWVPAMAVGAAAVIVAAALGRAFLATPATTLPDALRIVHDVASSGLPARMIAPCVALVRPFFAPDWAAYVRSLAAALVVVAVVTTWMLRTDEALYESGDGASAERVEAARPAATARRVPWRLAPLGRPELALAWRASADTIRTTGGVAMIRPLVAFAALVLAAVLASRQRGIGQLAFALATVGAGMAAVLGPQMLRIDLRQDLRNIDLLKTWPLRPADVVRGEILWPAAVLTLAAWIALAFALAASGSLPAVGLPVRVAVAAAAAIVTPAAIAAQLTIHNAAALAFPAWIATGSQRPHGLDAMGQRLILLGATMLLLALMLLPGAIAGGALWFVLKHVAGIGAIVPGAVACAIVVGLEVLVATEAIAPLYEKLDYSEIERSET